MKIVTITKYTPENLHECVYEIGIMDGSCINCTYRRKFTGNPENPCTQRAKFEKLERMRQMEIETTELMDEWLLQS